MMRNPTLPEKAAILLAELLANRLEVQKWPGRFGEGYVRGCVSVNAPWYSEFCGLYLWRSSRRYPKPRTIIKRYLTINALKKIQGGEHAGIYIGRLIEFIDGYTSDWCVDYQRKLEKKRLKAMAPAQRREHNRLMAQEF